MNTLLKWSEWSEGIPAMNGVTFVTLAVMASRFDYDVCADLYNWFLA